MLCGENPQLKGSFLYGAFSRLGAQEAEVANAPRGQGTHHDMKTRVSHRGWKRSHQMTVRIQIFCAPEAAEFVKFSTSSFAELRDDALLSVTNSVCFA